MSEEVTADDLAPLVEELLSILVDGGQAAFLSD